MRRVLIALVVLVFAGLSFLRWNRTRFTPPTQIAAGVFEVRQSFVSTYGVRTPSGVVLIDAGMDPRGAAIEALLGAMQAEREDVRAILLTHGHWDHTAAAPLFPSARIYGGESDVGLAAGTDKGHNPLAKLVVTFMQPPSVTIDHPLETDTTIGTYGKAFVLPGHTMGSMAYLLNGVLFVGDALKVSDGILVPWSDWLHLHMDAKVNRRSIWALQQRVATEDVDRVCGAHTGCTPAGMGGAALKGFVP